MIKAISETNSAFSKGLDVSNLITSSKTGTIQSACNSPNELSNKKTLPNHHLSEIKNKTFKKKIDKSTDNHYHYRLPILTSIELINNTKFTSDQAFKRNILYNDYVIIKSKTKYKNLLLAIFKQVKLSNKQNYKVISGKQILSLY